MEVSQFGDELAKRINTVVIGLGILNGQPSRAKRAKIQMHTAPVEGENRGAAKTRRHVAKGTNTEVQVGPRKFETCRGPSGPSGLHFGNVATPAATGDGADGADVGGGTG